MKAPRSFFPIFSAAADLVYLDSAATSQKPQLVIEAESRFYLDCNANPHRGIYPLSEKATEMYEQARVEVARFLGAPTPECIAFTSGTTMGINVIAHAWARKNLQAGDVVLTTIMEHHANIVPWQLLAEERDIVLKFVEMSDDGVLDLANLESQLQAGNVKLVCVAHVSNVLATRNPIRRITRLAHKYGAAILVDGAQSTGHMPVNVSNLDVDFYVMSGHKMLAPMGSGALYVATRRHQEMGVMFGGGDMISRVTPERAWFKPMPHRLEAGTQNVAGAVALAEATR